MALTRRLLESMGLESEKISTIIESHAETVEGLKAEIDKYKADAENAQNYKKELDSANKELESLKATGGDWQAKYEAEKKAFKEYKDEISAKEVLSAKDSAYRKLLRDANISEKRIDSIMKVTDLTGIELDGETIKDAESLTESIRTEWGDFIVSQETNGAAINTPPRNDNQKDLSAMSMAEYIQARKNM